MAKHTITKIRVTRIMPAPVGWIASMKIDVTHGIREFGCFHSPGSKRLIANYLFGVFHTNIRELPSPEW